METDGAMLRLGRRDFLKLLAEPLIAKVTVNEVQSMVEESTSFVDVRVPHISDSPALPDAQKTPFYMLRIAMERMSRSRSYICYCDDGRVSAAAVFLLRSSGFDAFVLEGGLRLTQKS